MAEEWLGKKNPWIGVPNTWIVVALIFVVMFTGVGAGLRARANLKSGQEYIEDLSGVEAPFDEGREGGFTRSAITVSLIVSQNDWQAGGSATPTTPVYTYFYSKPSADDTGEAITVAAEDVSVKASNGGILWIDCYGGTDFYLVESAFKNANPEVEQVVTEDWDGDGKLDFLAKLDLSQFLRGEQSFKPTFTLSMPLLDVDVAGLTSTNPANQGSIGTSETVVTIDWDLSAITAEDGAEITELYIVTNTTRQGEDLRLEEMYFTGQWTVLGQKSWSNPVLTTYGDYSGYYIKAGDNNDPLDPGGIIVFRDTNKADKLSISVNIRVTGESSEVYLIDLYVTFVTPAGVTSEVNDQVQLSI